MIILVGASGSGKSSIAKYLEENYDYRQIVSFTTRPPRKGEVDGKDYYFISKERFLELKASNFFAETAEYNGWYYGTAVTDYTSFDNRYSVAVLTPHGLRQIKKLKDTNIASFYIDVPRRDRLIKALERGDNIEEAYRRSLSDVGQFDGIEDEVDWVVSNPNYTKSIEEISEEVLKYSAMTLFGIVEKA